MRLIVSLVLVYICIQSIVCPPVNPKPPVEGGSDADTNSDTGLEYDRYLREVVAVLEQDEDFKKKLESANVTDIKNGNIAHQLEFVSHSVREKLDELKRRELQRLRELVREKMKTMNGIEKSDHKYPGHLDVANPHTFEIDDLKKLIQKTTSDLDEMDKQRRGDFKNYEMRKEHEKKKKLESMDEEHRKKAQEEFDAQQKKHKEHPKVHHPGSKDQFEEVWEEEDKLDKEDFDPKTFFKLHDLDNDGFWYEDEVRALFQKELDKVYDPDAPEDDMAERYEEMNRMREHLVKEMDKDEDRVISFDEYMMYVKGQDFAKEDEGWDTLDEAKQYTDEELQDYEKMMAEEDQRMRDTGVYDGHAQPGEVNVPQHHEGVVEMHQPELQPHPGQDTAQLQQEQLHVQQLDHAQQQQQQQQQQAAQQAQQQQQAAQQAQQVQQQQQAHQQQQAQQQQQQASQPVHQEVNQINQNQAHVEQAQAVPAQVQGNQAPGV